MPNVAFVFPGQGSQTVGMGRVLAEASPAAAAIFEEADRVLGESLSRLVFEGPADVLDRTVNAQPALLATSIAMLTVLRERWSAAGIDVRPMFCAGHSMGQYSALVAAGAMSFADALRLVRTRGQLMQASDPERPGAMGAVLGLDDGQVELALAAARRVGLVGVANRNAPGQVVISGERAAVEAALDAARAQRARKVVLLPVSVAAHSPLMAEAAEWLRIAVAVVPIRDPEPPLLANADAVLLTTADAARAELVDHLTTGVDWIAVVRAMSAHGVDTFLEIGPGRVLTGLIKRIATDASAIQVDAPDEGGIAPAAVHLATSSSASDAGSDADAGSATDAASGSGSDAREPVRSSQSSA
jgi:[acyl-carrier-protein] S-malonyltransferase